MLSIRKDDKAYTKVVVGILAFFIVLSAGILIYWEVSESLASTNTTAINSQDEVDDMMVTVVPLLVLVGLVIVAGVIIGIISKFGGQ